MNDLPASDGREAVEPGRPRSPAAEREAEYAQKHHPSGRRRWGGRLFALGGVLLLAAGLSMGAWRAYSKQQKL
jgi:hypothetical protein